MIITTVIYTCMFTWTLLVLQTVDRLIWYLRIVHSVDYFNGVVFPAEDHMPHRFGILTARAARPICLSVEEGELACVQTVEQAVVCIVLTLHGFLILHPPFPFLPFPSPLRLLPLPHSYPYLPFHPRLPLIISLSFPYPPPSIS